MLALKQQDGHFISSEDVLDDRTAWIERAQEVLLLMWLQ
jgi:hypothetical protein